MSNDTFSAHLTAQTDALVARIQGGWEALAAKAGVTLPPPTPKPLEIKPEEYEPLIEFIAKRSGLPVPPKSEAVLAWQVAGAHPTTAPTAPTQQPEQPPAQPVGFEAIQKAATAHHATIRTARTAMREAGTGAQAARTERELIKSVKAGSSFVDHALAQAEAPGLSPDESFAIAMATGPVETLIHEVESDLLAVEARR